MCPEWAISESFTKAASSFYFSVHVGHTHCCYSNHLFLGPSFEPLSDRIALNLISLLEKLALKLLLNNLVYTVRAYH